MKLQDKDIKRFRKFYRCGGKDECWDWLGGKLSDGYGVFWLAGKSVKAHRVAYKLSNGRLSARQNICHKCDNTSCVNPNHLFSGNQSQNIKDAMAKGRFTHYFKPGVKHPNAKFTRLTLILAKQLLKKGYSQSKIAKRFSVTQQCISRINTGARYGKAG